MAVQPILKPDRRNFDAKIRQMRANQVKAGRDLMLALGEIAVDTLVEFSEPFADTNRYLNGWVHAGTQIGVNRPLREIKRPKRFYLIRNQLRQQMKDSEKLFRFWSRRVAEMEEREGHQKWKSYRRAKKKLSKFVDIYDRAIDNYERFEETKGVGVLHYHGKKSAFIDDAKLSAVDRLITKTYGGTGRVFKVGNQWFVELRNREPHARKADRRHRVVARTKARLRLVAARNASSRYLETLSVGATGKTAGIRRAA